MSNGTHDRSGAFSQEESYSSDARTAEQYYEHSRRLSLEAAKSEERAQRLESAASFAESHGFALSEDLSQFLTSRYIEKQNVALRELNLPDLYRTDLARDQRAGRDFAIRQILDEFIREPRATVAERLDEPDLVSVRPPASLDPGGLGRGLERPGIPTSMSARPDTDMGRAAEIAQGREELGDAAARADSHHAQTVRAAASLRAQHEEATDRVWFDKRK